MRSVTNPETGEQRWRCVVCHAIVEPLRHGELRGRIAACNTCRYRPEHQRLRRDYARSVLTAIVEAAEEGLSGLTSFDAALGEVYAVANTAQLEILAAPVEPEHPDWQRAA